MKKVICCVLISLMIFSGCVEKSVQETKNDEVKDYISYSIETLPKNLVMLSEQNTREEDLLCNLFEGLVKVDEKGKIAPALSESWTLNKDGTGYTFKIRENAKWSNGKDITAEDFVNFFSQILNKDVNNIYADELYYIFGAEEYNKGKGSFSNVAIRAVDNKSLEIRLNYPCSYFLNILSQPIYALRKIDNNLVDWKKNYKNILYSGAFQIDNIIQNSEILLKKNNNYWDNNLVKSEKILISCMDSSEAALASFQNDKINLFINPPINEYKNLKDNANYLKILSHETGTLVFNLKKDNVIKDVNFRKAVAFNIDRNNIAKEILNDTAESALSYIPPNFSNGIGGKYINKNFFVSNSEKEKAIELIKKVKLENNQALKLIYIDKIENKKICESISKSLHDNLGIDIDCEAYEVNDFNDELKKNNYDIAKIDFDASYDYPLSFLERWISFSNLNLYGYNNSKFDDTVLKSKMEKDINKKIELLKESEDILLEDMVVVPLYFKNIIICKKNDIEGIYVTENGNIKLDRVYMILKP